MSRTFCTPLLKSSVMNSLTRECPITSSLLYPTSLIAHWFQTLTRPRVSTPKIGALAKSIRRVYSLSWASRPVMSCPIPTTPITLPCSSRRVVALRRTSKRTPALVIRGNSKLAVSSPCKASSRTACTAVLNSSVMNS